MLNLSYLYDQLYKNFKSIRTKITKTKKSQKKKKKKDKNKTLGMKMKFHVHLKGCKLCFNQKNKNKNDDKACVVNS